MANNNRAAIAVRRQHVWACVCEGMTSYKIAEYLKCDQTTVSKDIRFLTKDSNKYLNDMAKETLPYIYKQSIEGMYNILLECWKRYKGDGNLFALKLALECHKEITNQALNGVSVIAVKKIAERANSLGIGLENDGR